MLALEECEQLALHRFDAGQMLAKAPEFLRDLRQDAQQIAVGAHETLMVPEVEAGNCCT